MTNNAFFRCFDIKTLPDRFKNGVVAIGNFDGVHRGHQVVLNSALSRARQLECPALVLTFEPHPRSVFEPETILNRLTSADEKAEIFKLMGFDCVIEQCFTHEFAAQTAEDFIETLIVGELAARAVVTGYDFHFGAKRAGSPAFLQREGARFAFEVIVVEPYKNAKGEVVSSTFIRSLLTKGSVDEAAELLGYRYTITSEVIHGAQLGRKLGFPTANMRFPQSFNFAYGIYAVRFRRADSKLYDGVASFGQRPTVDEAGVPLLETYLFDFSGDLYGEKAAVSFFKFLRHEQKFPTLEALVKAMEQDSSQAKIALDLSRPLSAIDRSLTFSDQSSVDLMVTSQDRQNRL